MLPKYHSGPRSVFPPFKQALPKSSEEHIPEVGFWEGSVSHTFPTDVAPNVACGDLNAFEHLMVFKLYPTMTIVWICEHVKPSPNQEYPIYIHVYLYMHTYNCIIIYNNIYIYIYIHGFMDEIGQIHISHGFWTPRIL